MVGKTPERSSQPENPGDESRPPQSTVQTFNV